MHYAEAKGILSSKNVMNVYRGCTHGCIYCDSRSKCYNMTHDFEDIEVKINAPELLEKALLSKRKKCMIATGSMCDPYIPLEESLMITRQCLEIIYKHGFGVSLITKSSRVLRDLDLFKKINDRTKCVVTMTLTTYDEELCKIVEPNVSTTKERFEVLKIMRDNGIPTVVWLCPILPFINDTEENLRGILSYCTEAKVRGILSFGAGMTLRDGDREYYYQMLDRHFPGLSEKYHRIYGYNYEISSLHGRELMKIMTDECKKHNILCKTGKVFDYLAEFEDKQASEQLSLF